ncbi:DUF3888 domain-containing protein [Priestia sp. FSL W8-0524]|uniref:DUF3888 domain-containing protein n=1 Tax=Priestia sp. FSL W8-0524 TaxID=2954625 RepID=UPI0015F6125E|nr:DUF3888 domain-containing protein [Bacillus zanthoxyli]
MRKIIVSIFTLLLLSNASVTYANRDLPTNTKATRENILEDTLIDLLYPQMIQAAEKYYGVKNSKGIRFDCQKVLSIRKLDHPGSMMFEARLEGRTYFGPHNPPNDVFTVTIKSDYHTNGWEMQSFKVRKLKPHEVYECRDPA